MSGAASASFVYDGDGNRVQATFGSSTIVYPSTMLRAGVGDYYEQGGARFGAGGERVAVRENGTLYWLLTDHLGSTAITANSSGTRVAELRYKAWGETRYTYGTTPTAYKFTGQREDGTMGLYFYKARYYDPVIGRFIQPDPPAPPCRGAVPPERGDGGYRSRGTPRA